MDTTGVILGIFPYPDEISLRLNSFICKLIPTVDPIWLRRKRRKEISFLEIPSPYFNRFSRWALPERIALSRSSSGTTPNGYEYSMMT